MRITAITWQHRRDIRFTAECEHCGHVITNQTGYDDHYFHETVVPKQECPECCKPSDVVGDRPEPRYLAHHVV